MKRTEVEKDVDALFDNYKILPILLALAKRCREEAIDAQDEGRQNDSRRWLELAARLGALNV